MAVGHLFMKHRVLLLWCLRLIVRFMSVLLYCEHFVTDNCSSGERSAWHLQSCGVARSGWRSCTGCGTCCWSGCRRRDWSCSRRWGWFSSFASVTNSCSGSMTKRRSWRRTSLVRTWSTLRCCRRSSTSSRRTCRTTRTVSMTLTSRLTNWSKNNTRRRKLCARDVW